MARTPITMWELLVWAYKRQMVQYEVDRAEGPDGYLGQSSSAFAAEHGGVRGVNASERGCINGAGTTAHEDAHVVHGYVRLLKRSVCELVIRTSAKGVPPVWNPSLPPCRVVPVRRGGGGAIRLIYGKSNRPIACMIGYEGFPESEARRIREAAHESYAVWWMAVRALRTDLWGETRLTRWKVTQTGAPREPWN
jgi:hypothetical protein